MNLQESDADFTEFVVKLRAATKDKALLVQGSNTLSRLLLSLEAGADLVSTDLPTRLMEAGQALVFDDILLIPDDFQHVRQEEENVDMAPSKKHKGPSGQASAPTSEVKENLRAVVNLWNDEFLRDKSSLVAGCQCHACKYHTRGYIHHLLKSKRSWQTCCYTCTISIRSCCYFDARDY